MTEKSASTAASSTPPAPNPGPEIDDQTHRTVPAPPPPPPTAGAAESAAVAAGTSAETSTTGASPVKDGAVKAAAAALAAARSAAKKVQSALPENSGPANGERPAAEQTRVAGGAAEGAEEPPPEMHYSAGTVHGATAASGAMPATAAADAGPRRVRLSISRIDPWSVMKLAFLLSVAIGFMIVVATMVVWYVLNDMGTFATIQTFLQETVGPQTVNIVQFIEFDRVVSLSVLIAIIDIVLLTAVATILAILYNVTAALVGGVHLTLTDE
jgi:hypothetical protein